MVRSDILNELLLFRLSSDFLPFSQAELLELTDREMVAWAKRASDRHNVSLSWTKDVLLGVARGYNVHYGARSIKHEVERKIVGPIAAAHESRRIKSGSAVYVSAHFVDEAGRKRSSPLIEALVDGASGDADESAGHGDEKYGSILPTHGSKESQVVFTFQIKQPGSSSLETFVPDA
jgi:hypothetical protein